MVAEEPPLINLDNFLKGEKPAYFLHTLQLVFLTLPQPRRITQRRPRTLWMPVGEF